MTSTCGFVIAKSHLKNMSAEMTGEKRETDGENAVRENYNNNNIEGSTELYIIIVCHQLHDIYNVYVL